MLNKWSMGLMLSLCIFSAAAEKQQYYGRSLCDHPDFKCIKVKPRDSWTRLFPDIRDREIVKRLNRTNIPLNYRKWIVVPRDLKNIDYLDLSPFPLTIKPTGERLVIVNLSLGAYGAYNAEGNLVHWGPISGGREWCEDINAPCNTVLGVFRVFRKQGPECKSSKFPIEKDGGAPMPWCMHFNEGFALHGSSVLPGFNASHGCVRLFEEDAEWLNKSFIQIGTKIMVIKGNPSESEKDDEDEDKPKVKKRKRTVEYQYPYDDQEYY